MNILHVLSQFEVTGAEAYAVTLAEEQLREGHLITIVSDTLTLPTRGTYTQVPIGQRSYPQRIRNILTLVRLIRRRSIDVVHAHSRAASWVSWFAARWTRTAFVSTVHGRQHIHPSSTSTNVYGRTIIAVSSAIKDHLSSDLRIPSQYIDVIPNCISCDHWEQSRSAFLKGESTVQARDDMVLFVGRLTGPKGDVVRLLLQNVLPLLLQKRMVHFRSVGGMITPNDFPQMISAVNTAFGQPVAELLGFQSSVAPEILKATVVIGSGRVVPDTLMLRKPAIAFGESGYVGPVTPETFARAAETNFGDTGVHSHVDVEKVAADILHVLQHPPTESDREKLSLLTRSRYDTPLVARAVLNTYRKAVADARSPRSIPVLMYHRVLPESGEYPTHGIWVREKDFAQQMESLSRRGFHTITFRDYERFLQGEKSLPPHPIILTFDDGYADNFTIVLPMLQQYGFRAVIYAVTDQDRRTNFWDAEQKPAPLLSIAQMKELDRSGMEIGSHTVTHARLTEVSTDAVRRELTDSKSRLEEMLGTEISSFAYPYGALNPPVKAMVGETGYRFAAAADTGPTALHGDFLEIRRTQVFPWTGMAGFWKKTLPSYQRYKQLKA